MSETVTLYLSMFRQNASGSNCDMITTGDPTIRAKGSSITPPEIRTSQYVSLYQSGRSRPTEDIAEWQNPEHHVLPYPKRREGWSNHEAV